MHTVHELAGYLRQMANTATGGNRVTKILLFGIRYAQSLERVSIAQVVEEAGIPVSYTTEISKAVRLSRYVSETNLT